MAADSATNAIMNHSDQGQEQSGAMTSSYPTIQNGVPLSDSMKRLSLSTAAGMPLPPSSPPVTTPVVTPIKRAPSSSSVRSIDRSTTPTLKKRASLNSLKGLDGVTSPRSPVIRRTSSQFSPSLDVGGRPPLPTPLEEPSQPPLTAATVAYEFFKKELEAHRNTSSSVESRKCAVILQDDCYGHRYSRPRTSKANLNTIVERPERIHASILGLATAYVRLGGRHSASHSAPYLKDKPTSFRPPPFIIKKTKRKLSLKSPAATAIHGAEWMAELSAMCEAAESKLALGGKELTRPDVSGPTQPALNVDRPNLHEGDLYLCSGSLDALEGALGGVCEGVDTVFEQQGPHRVFVCIRPPGHHCSSQMPSGFCWLNNVHVGISHAVLAHGLTHAAIIDFDLHHGDGSQSITWAHNSRVSSRAKNTPISKRTAIGYFSLHDINSYPCEMGDEEKVRNASLCIENAHGQSIWNVHLQPWKTEAQFWKLYEDRYTIILAKARNFLRLHAERLRQAPTHPKPKAAIFLSAGFDASEWESPGMQRHQVNVPTEFYARLTRDVILMSEEQDLGVDGRVISVLEGGYSDRALMSGVLSHMSGLATASASSEPQNRSKELDQNIERPELRDHSMVNGIKGSNSAFEPQWWSLPRLEELELLLNPVPSMAAPKKQRSDVRPKYSSATQSFTAKIVSPSPNRRSFSGSVLNAHQQPKARVPSPPPPDIDWATAAHEMCKLLVPSDRETTSCKPEDLNAEASRARRNRYSGVGLPTTVDEPSIDPKRMQLRDRRGKPPQYVSEEEDEKPPTRANRRKTIADVSLPMDGNEPPLVPSTNPTQGHALQHNRRRSSIASITNFATAEKSLDNIVGTRKENQPKGETRLAKKSRAPMVSRPEATKTKNKAREVPGARTASTKSTTSIPEDTEISGPYTAELPKGPLAMEWNPSNPDFDQLATDMRSMSINLNAPPRETHTTKEPAPKAVPKARVTKPAGPKASKTSSPTKSRARKAKASTTDEPQSVAHINSQQPPAPMIQLDGAKDVQRLPHSNVQIPLQPVVSEQSTEPTMAVPSYQDQSQNAYHSEAIMSMASGTTGGRETQFSAPELEFKAPAESQAHMNGLVQPPGPMIAKRTKHDLPIFTSTSSIAFGTPKPDKPSASQFIDLRPTTIESQGPLEDQIHTLPSAPNNNHPVVLARHENSSLDRHLEDAPLNLGTGNQKMQSQTLDSVWDVPDTPHKA